VIWAEVESGGGEKVEMDEEVGILCTLEGDFVVFRFPFLFLSNSSMRSCALLNK